MNTPLLDWHGDQAHIFQNPRHLLPAPAQATLLRGTLLFPTSGSSGQPKWVAHTRASMLASAAAVNVHLEVTPGDAWCCGLPTFHVGGCAIHARACLGGNTVHSYAEAWSAGRFHQYLTETQATLTSLVPTQVHDLVQARFPSPERLRAVVIGGGALRPDLYTAARYLGWPLLPSYGMTEAASQVATATLGSLHAATYPSLKVLGHWEARTTATGLLQLRGPGLFHGYYCQHQPQTWEWQNPFQQDWFQTTDRAELLPDGQFQWRGRADRVVKILGELVDLDAIEQFFLKHAQQEVIILPVPDPRSGHQLHAVATQSNATAHAAYNATCPPYARVATWHVLPTLPRSPLGKPLRAEIAQLLS
jgi:o-succinylbenzoate---CoA ligase